MVMMGMADGMAAQESEITRKKRERWGRWFTEHLATAGYESQQEFADASGFARVQVQRWASGAVRPRENNLTRITEALNGKRAVVTIGEVYRAASYQPPEMGSGDPIGITGDGPHSPSVWVHITDIHAADIPPELEYVYGLYGNIVDALPPGRRRDNYIASLRAQAESTWQIIHDRLDDEEPENMANTK